MIGRLQVRVVETISLQNILVRMRIETIVPQPSQSESLMPGMPFFVVHTVQLTYVEFVNDLIVTFMYKNIYTC